MISLMAWLLITVSDGSYNRGASNLIATFSKQAECERVLSVIKQMGSNNVIGKCIQAEIFAEKAKP